MEKTKILLIDDEKAICQFMKINLERTGEYEITIAYSGEEGLEKAKAVQFDLVITDFLMPGMDGAAVLRALKERSPSVPVVLFSVYHDDTGTITPEIDRLADGLISKPIDRANLHRAIKEALAKRGRGGAS